MKSIKSLAVLVIFVLLLYACQAGADINPDIKVTNLQSNQQTRIAPITKESAATPNHPSDGLGTSPVYFSPAEILPFSFSPDSPRLLLRTNLGVQVIDHRTGEEESYYHAQSPITSAALSKDGQILAWALEDNRIQLIRLKDQEVMADLVGHPDPALDLHFLPVGERLFSASHDRTH